MILMFNFPFLPEYGYFIVYEHLALQYTYKNLNIWNEHEPSLSHLPCRRAGINLDDYF